MVSDLTDKEQIELFKKWWRDYGKSITFAVIIGLCIGFGWRYWHQYKIHQAQRASAIYFQLQTAYAQNQANSVKELTTLLVDNYTRTPYATLAAFLVARDAVQQKNYAVALQQLQWIIQRSQLSSFRQIARLRAARVLLAEKQLQPALQMLQPVEDAAYQPLIEAVKGDIYSAMGNASAANQAYQAAKNQLRAANIDDPFLQMKASQD